MSYNGLMLLAYWVFLAIPGLQGPEASCLDLRAAVYQDTVMEQLPLVIRVTLANTCQSPVSTWYYPETGDLMERWALLVVVDGQGKVLRLNYIGGPAARQARPVPMPLVEGTPFTKDFVRSLIFREPPPPRWAGKSRDLLRFLAPGLYVAHLEVPHLNGQKIVSNEFEFRVVEATGTDSRARDHIVMDHVDFFEGRDAAPEESYYHGGKWWRKVDVSRFQEIQKILDDYPDSQYAEWIRFWKVYHHGPVDDAIEYARTHQDFPLSDNLMLRMAERLFHQAGKYDRATYDRVRGLVAELLRGFPDGDTRTRALLLQEKLTKKP